jgi:hypothetical protein
MGMFPFVGGDYNARSPSFDGQRTINLYPEGSESKTSRSPAMLIGTPGLEVWTTTGSGGVRGALVFTDALAVFVIGSQVYTANTSAAMTLIGTGITGSGPVSMASNGTVVMMVNGPDGFIIDPNGGTTTQITDPDFLGADTVDFADGFFVFNKRATGQFQITQLYGTDIDALDFATAEGSPDNIVSVIVDHREVWLLGRVSTEVWINNGDIDFPFARIQGAFLEVGCAAAHSVAKMDNSIFWLANDERGFGTVQRAAGYTPQRVSNHAVEYAISNYSRIDDAVAYTYTQEGHSFYVLSFPTADATWVLDVSNGQWHERAYRYPATGLFGRHRSNCHANFAGKTLVGDWESGIIYSMRLDVYTDNGEPLRSERICPHIAGDGKLAFHHALEVFMQPGVGLEDGAAPQAMLQWSDDGGYTWSSEHWVSVGKIGEYRTRTRWRRLGRSRDRVYRWAMTDPVKRIITAANLNVTAAAS